MTPEEFLTKCRELNVIPLDPLNRISDPVKREKSKNNCMYDVHVHTFHKDCINESYFIVKMLGEKIRRGKHLFNDGHKFLVDDSQQLDYVLEEFLENYSYDNEEEFYANPSQEIKWGDIERTFANAAVRPELEEANLKKIEHIGEAIYYIFSRFLRMTSQEQVLNDFYKNFAVTKIDGFYDRPLISCLLMMDFYKEFNGPVKRSLSLQIEDYNNLSANYPVMSFLAIDPRRMEEQESSDEHLFNLFLKAFNRKKNGLFFGVKFYPSLGYSPSDYRLIPIYEICMQYQIPVVTHCGGEIVSTFSDDIWVYENFSKQKSRVQGSTRKDKVFYLNDPERWAVVLEKYPSLKINFAHFGNDEAFYDYNEDESRDYIARKDTILNFMKEYDGVYTDFSYAFTSPHVYTSFINTLLDETSNARDRVMFGTDFWVALFAKGERFAEHQTAFVQLFKDYPVLMNKVFKSNAESYLFKTIN